MAVALDSSSEGMAPYVAELQARRDLVVAELDGLPVGSRLAGGACFSA
jgi:hypothetical protein